MKSYRQPRILLSAQTQEFFVIRQKVIATENVPKHGTVVGEVVVRISMNGSTDYVEPLLAV